MLREYEQYSNPDVLLCWHSTKTLSIFLYFVTNKLLPTIPSTNAAVITTFWKQGIMKSSTFLVNFYILLLIEMHFVRFFLRLTRPYLLPSIVVNRQSKQVICRSKYGVQM